MAPPKKKAVVSVPIPLEDLERILEVLHDVEGLDVEFTEEERASIELAQKRYQIYSMVNR